MNTIIYDTNQMNNEFKQCITYFQEKDYAQLVKSLLQLADPYSLHGNLWQSLLTMILINNENSFTLSLERKVELKPSFIMAVKQDLELFYTLFHTPIEIENEAIYDLVTNYQCTKKIVNREIFDIIQHLQYALNKSSSLEEFYSILSIHYYQYGVGKYGLNKAFRYQNNSIQPIEHIGKDAFDDLIGCSFQINQLCTNTQAFLEGKMANNVLLYGDSGTGKSSSIKALLNTYYKDGLRMIEIYKHQFIDLPKIIQELQSRNYKFIIFMDDLSFEDFEVEYKYLKAVIEGGLEKKPDNILIYATSNRRHLIKQSWNDRTQDEVSVNDAKQEKLSLSSRFGLSILFVHPLKKEYFTIVEGLSNQLGLDMELSELHAKANTWAVRCGSFSGRVARQFVQAMLIEK